MFNQILKLKPPPPQKQHQHLQKQLNLQLLNRLVEQRAEQRVALHPLEGQEALQKNQPLEQEILPVKVVQKQMVVQTVIPILLPTTIMALLLMVVVWQRVINS